MIFRLIILILLTSCTSPYSGGNIGSICDVKTNFQLKTIKQISDTLFNEGMYIVPKSLSDSLNIDDYKFLDYKTYYFNDSPKQIYLLTFDGLLLIRMIYDLGTKKWITRESKLSEKEIEKISKRFTTYVIKDIELKAKSLGLPDSAIYFPR